MSTIEEEEGSKSLLGHDDEPASLRWKQDRAQNRRRVYILLFLTILLVIPLTVFLVMYLPWNSTWSSILGLSGHPENITAQEHTRDLRSLLHPENHVSREAGSRRYSWNITKAMRAPNGVEKEVFLINDRFPGPTIEARSGDVLEIEVNNFSEEEISFHWHGLHMRGANDMDGPVGITQCGIKQGQTFLYKVPIDEQVGTFWYHAHSEVHRADGLYGGLVVHNPVASLDSISYQYDKELLLMVGDWYHWPAEKVLGRFMDRTSLGNEPAPDSMLINGLGHFECGMATHGAPVNCSEIGMPAMVLDKRYRYRMRIVNVGSMTGITFAIPDADMNIITVDGGNPVAEVSQQVNSIGVLYPAERVDLVVSWPDSAVDTETEIMIELDKEYLTLRPNFALTPSQSFPLSPSTTLHPKTTSHHQTHHFDLAHLQAPTLPSPLPEPDGKFMIYTTIQILTRLSSRPHGFVNHTTFSPMSRPLLSLPRTEWDEHQLVPWTGSEAVWVELVINNMDGTGHPFHLHGHDFYILTTYTGHGGFDYYNPFTTPPQSPRGGPFNLLNPVKKDTVYVPQWGYVVIRFRADNEGIWALHCHVLWHGGSGMSMGFQVLGEDEDGGFSEADLGRRAGRSCGQRP